MNRRAFVLACLLALPPMLARSPGAEASTSRLVTLDELVGFSTYIVVGTAGESRSVWEDMPSGRRIVTYTRITVERTVGGSPPTNDALWVRTLGGAVDKIGQAVPGEAQLPTGSRSLLFLAQAGSAVVVAARAQGHYPVVTDEKGTPRLASSPDLGMLLARPGPTISARERLLGNSLEDAVALVQRTGKARDEKK